MFSFKFLIAAAALVCVSARHLVLEDENNYYLLPLDEATILEDDEVLEPARSARMRRQLHGVISNNPDGTSGANFKLPIAGGDRNILSAVGGLDLDRHQQITGKTAGLALDNINGHSLMLAHSQLPNADRNTAAANVNLFNNGDHKLDANAFVARTMPHAAQIPNFNTYGAGADYMFKDKVGARVNMARTPLFDRTDYSAMGKLNVFHGRDSSLDFNAGLSKSVSPFLPKSSWEPSAGLTFKKWF